MLNAYYVFLLLVMFCHVTCHVSSMFSDNFVSLCRATVRLKFACIFFLFFFFKRKDVTRFGQLILIEYAFIMLYDKTGSCAVFRIISASARNKHVLSLLSLCNYYMVASGKILLCFMFAGQTKCVVKNCQVLFSVTVSFNSTCLKCVSSALCIHHGEPRTSSGCCGCTAKTIY